MSTAIGVSDLSKHYGTVHAVRGVCLAVKSGEIFGLLGPNGAGKTTTLECILGLRRPDAGTIEVAGVDVLKDGRRAREVIGAQLQTTALQDKMTPRQALRLFGAFYQQPAEVEELLARFELLTVANRSFDTLSGGYRQRLALALALVNRPRVVLLDEPTAGLDAQVRRQTHGAIKWLKETGQTVLLTTHYIEEAEQLCDRVAIIHQGKIAALGTPAELVARARSLPWLRVRTRRMLEAAALRGLAGVTGVVLEEQAWRVTTAAVTATIAALVQLTQTSGSELEDLQIHRPTLEDVFLELTGAPLEAPSGGEACAA